MTNIKAVERMGRASLFDVATSALIERALAQASPEHALMAAAGQSIAQLAMAIAPNAQLIWIACGPGNNGGDGMAAALALHRLGKAVYVTSTIGAGQLPPDAQWASDELDRAGITRQPFDANGEQGQAELIIDALLGIGTNRPVTGDLAAIVGYIRRRAVGGVPVLAVDVPTGLSADTGHANEAAAVKATHTLSLIALRPGLFTAMGRELSGKVWFEPIGADTLLPQLTEVQAVATLGVSSQQKVGPTAYSRRSHASHKGQFGDVAVVGGEPGMEGAAILAAQAALKTGAGRVFLSLLPAPETGTGHLPISPRLATIAPDIMLKPWTDIDLPGSTVVAGCGAGQAIASAMATLVSTCPSLVLDADALNFLALDPKWQEQFRIRHAKGWATVLTPHPKEAARLLGCTVVAVQQDRLHACKQLANRFLATVLLKGSGTIIASPNGVPVINQTGNGKLAIAGTGDVLAGMVGAALAQLGNPQRAAEHSCYWHGWFANHWPSHQSLTASELVQRLNGI